MPLFGGFKKPAFVFILLVGMTTASNFVSAQCQAPKPPVFPSVDHTDFSTMEAAERNMQRYVDQTEDYLDCLTPEERKVKMDGVLEEMRRITAKYNTLSVAYRKSKTQQLFSESSK